MLERSWREEEDGTVVVLFKSCEFDVQPEKKETLGWSSWFGKPVKAWVSLIFIFALHSDIYSLQGHIRLNSCTLPCQDYLLS